ncbi:hypothetical protein G647_01976 [Cladophialophora carrionii CBS 160.54]|uniref:Cytochrome c oxidase assembly factor 6 n=1 Tax=Cladophialophora carrionii CBS 160.54 TaxID=1279043 RepID=V9DT74_9EURO|nr:uncharacterized protein G647_01976 [Cladophialophora carrionii CBS 160.54]ETI29523.1 hypothetical protein G647_01976 [Cladophialophora carrionii CBS 160.54]
MTWGLPSWLGGSSNPSLPQSANQPPRSKDGGYVAPDRTSREHCYESRDAFFQCLDRHDILDAVKEDEKSRKLCPTEVVAYERDCARSWIKYFKEKRVMDYKRDRTLQQIAKEDAAASAKAKAERGGKSWFG